MATFNFVRSFATSAISRAVIRPPVQFFGVDGRYATALYSAAVKSKNLDIVEKDVTKLKQTLEQDIKLKQFCNDPTIKKHFKVEAFKKVLTKLNFSSQATNMLLVLAENGRLGILSKVIDVFGKIMTAHRGEVSCVITTAKVMDRAMERELIGALEGFLESGQKLTVTLKVDPVLIGGMVVTIGDKYADMSILRKVRSFKNLLEQPV